MKLFYLFTLRNVRKTLVSQHNLILNVNKHDLNVSKLQKQDSTLSEISSATNPGTCTMDIDEPHLKSAKAILLSIFDSAVASVLPGVLIDKQVQLDGDKLVVNGKAYTISEHVYLVGFGKAVAGMAYSLLKLLESRLRRGIISVPRTSLCLNVGEEFPNLRERALEQLQNLQMLQRSGTVEFCEGAENNQPDEASLATTDRIVQLVEMLDENDTLIVLVSGGGSALLYRPKPPLTAETKRELCRNLQNAGASITELNAVRKQLSSVKGGGLVTMAHPATVLAFVLSDIVGDPLESIASGPTCPLSGENPKQEAIDILKKYGIYNNVDEDVQHLFSSEEGSTDAKDLIKYGKFKHVTNIVIGNNETALNAAEKAARYFDLKTIILTNTVQGDVKDVSFAYAKLTRIVCHALQKKFPKEEDFMTEVNEQNIEILNICQKKIQELYTISSQVSKNKCLLLLCGGEPTVVVEGNGLGGRNQELALRFSLDWLSEIAKDPEIGSHYFVLFLSAGTDGQDGPTEAAGAFGRPAFQPKLMKLRQKLLEKKKLATNAELPKLEYKIQQVEDMLPVNVLKRNDSYSFFSRFENGKNLVKTELTGTNVMDLHFIYIKRRDCECDINDLVKHDDEPVLEDRYFTFYEEPVNENDQGMTENMSQSD